MNDFEINVAVAECCGIDDQWLMRRYDLSAATFSAFDRIKLLPDFANSRDAMAIALETLTEEEQRKFIFNLGKDCGVREQLGYSEAVLKLMLAPVRSWAVNFLKTKGKWRDA